MKTVLEIFGTVNYEESRMSRLAVCYKKLENEMTSKSEFSTFSKVPKDDKRGQFSQMWCIPIKMRRATIIQTAENQNSGFRCCFSIQSKSC